jgi:hypothetical protein
MAVQKMQVVVQKKPNLLTVSRPNAQIAASIFLLGQLHRLSKKRHSRRLPVLAARDLKNSGRQTFRPKITR